MTTIDFETVLAHLRKTIDGTSEYVRRYHPEISSAGSQFEEDQIVASLLPENTGTYIDIGASHPMECSNTWSLYQKGWRGLLIEPLHANWPALLRHRPGDLLSPIAVMDYTGLVTMRVCGSVSSVREDWSIEAQSELTVECDTIAGILTKYPVVRENCQLLSIDVEGAEWNVIRGMDWSNFKPKVIVVEKLKYEPDRPGIDLSPEWKHLIMQEGYTLRGDTGLNAIYSL